MEGGKEEKKRAALELDRDAIKEHLIEQQQGADPVLLKALLEAEAIAQESDRIFRLGSNWPWRQQLQRR